MARSDLATSPTLIRPGTRTRQRAIVEAARQVFLRDGYDGASVDAIAERAGVSKQTIYNYGSDKDQLFIQVIEEATEACGTGWMAGLADIAEHQTDLEEELLAYARLLVEKALDPEGLAIRPLLLTIARKHPHLVDDWIRNGQGTILRTLAERFAGMNERGILSIPAPDRAASQFFAMITWEADNASSLGSSEADPGALDEAIRSAVRLFIAGYAPRA